jgi:hypothetical protein
MSAAVQLADTVLGPWWRAKEAIRKSMFEQQLALNDDPAQFKECHAGRRGGKSDGMPKSTAMDALDARLNEVVLIGAETLKKARALHWANLAAVVREFDLPLTPNGQDATWVNPQGGRVQFWGLNDANAVEELRGFKVRAARFDEAATLSPMLPRLVTDVLEPALGDLGGQLTLYGSPSKVRAGHWFEICEGKERGKWSHHHWDARQNPFFRSDRGGAAAWFAEVLERNHWTWETPAFQCEYLGLFVNDNNAMCVQYDATKHSLDALPGWYSPAARHVVGVDYGFNDSFSMVVQAVDPYSMARCFVYAWKAARLTYDDAADALKGVLERFGATDVVCDPAGGGKPFYETFNRKYGAKLGVSVRSAQRVAGSVVESYRFQNTELRTGRLHAFNGLIKPLDFEYDLDAVKPPDLRPACGPLTDEWQVLPWKDEWKDEPDPAYENHCTDGGRYALTETLTWKPKEAPKSESAIEREEREHMERAARKARQLDNPMSKLKSRWG